MSRLHEVLNLIEIIRDSFPNSIEVYTKGSCVQFAPNPKYSLSKG